MARLSPVLPLIGADTRFQPVYVDDVAAAAGGRGRPAAPAGVYELGGPEVATFRALMERMLGIIRRRRLIVALPCWLARLQARRPRLRAAAERGLVVNALLTRDQVRLLARDNVVAPGAQRLRRPRHRRRPPMEAVLESYLYAYRPPGSTPRSRNPPLRMRT